MALKKKSIRQKRVYNWDAYMDGNPMGSYEVTTSSYNRVKAVRKHLREVYKESGKRLVLGRVKEGKVC